MVRSHGWQLPAHTLQVVAITVFFLLVVAFYAFFAPFLGKRVLEYVFYAIYSPLALAVFILYIRCTRINPADPGIMSKFDNELMYQTNNPGMKSRNLPDNLDEIAVGTPSSALSMGRSSLDGKAQRRASAGDERVDFQMDPPRKNSSCCFKFGGILCAIFAKEDCRKEDTSEQHAGGEDALFCSLCNAEVRKFSKHCRSCDKCVDGFDHHCRWLNNCVGRSNYVSFISLMATSLIWLSIESGVGIAVFVLCFADKKRMESNIVDKLGNGFSLAPFATVVAICTTVSILACVPLGELFFFHMILIKKGITTYEYVVAMRAMSEAPPASVDENREWVSYSPTNSAITGISGGSSLGLPYKGVWCTPPRVFVAHQDEVIPHLQPGMVPSTVDPDDAGYVERANKSRKAVKISAWKLAKLDSTEALRAAAKARASSSVLRPVNGRRIPGSEFSSSCNASGRSSLSIDFNANKETKVDMKSPLGNSYPESFASKEDYETGTPTASSFSSPGHIPEAVALSPLPSQRAPPNRPAIPRAPLPYTQLTNPMFQSATSLVRENKRASVIWDQEAGRFVSASTSSRPDTTMEALARTSRASVINPLAMTSDHGRRPILPNPSPALAPMQQPERLTYTGQSIFFGGPLLSAPIKDGWGSEGPGSSRPEVARASNVLREAHRERGQAVDNFPVYAPGALQKNQQSNIK